ncbi:DUF2207 domain-containing protein [Rhizobium sp. Pop5]|nr:DUF2207 domain-containing protein [Rhizobium sp. Pop5]UVD57593.1 DUF2207 domain-containing protein [Rhizobium sp. Pop5]
MLVLLTSCSDFDKEFAVQSAKTTIEVSTDGTAFVSESFDILVKKDKNYGGVYIDIPQRFKDASGGVHGRDFDLVAARRDGTDEYYFKENNVPGYSIYIGEEHCKGCPADLLTGITKIQIAYRLGRLVRQEGARQVLFLPAYMGSVHDHGAKKTLTLKVPRGGALRPSRDEPASYDIIQQAPDEFVVSIAAGKGDRVLPDIEIEYPVGTFVAVTGGKRVQWWFSDHLLPFLSILGPLIVGLVVILKFRPSWLLPASLIAVDIKMIESISPALAAYLFRDWKADAANAAFMASVCQLAVKRVLRISRLDEDAEASDLLPKHERRKGKPGRAKWYGLPAATRLVFARIGKERPVDARRRIKNARSDVRVELHRTVIEEYRKIRGIDWWSFAAAVSILSLGIAVARFSGLFIFSSAICGILLIPLLVLTMFRHPERFPLPADGFERFKRVVGLIVGLPTIMVFALSYVGRTGVISEQRPYLAAILLDIAGIIAVLAILRMPTSKQRKIRNYILGLERYFRGEINGPAMSVECFENYLPFAVALDVEQRWTERFNLWRESEKMTVYAPNWLITA